MNYIFKSVNGLKIKHLPILGHGRQGTVFKNGSFATKVFSSGSSRINDMSGDVTNRISCLNLNAFVKPFNLVFKKNILYSFDMELLHIDKNKKIVDMNIEDVIFSLNLIRKDVDILSSFGVKINDLQMHNIGISDDKIRVFDFSDYSFCDNRNLKKINDSEIDSLFGSLCLMEEMSDIDSIKIYDNIYVDYFRSGCSSIEEYFSLNVLGKYKNLREFVNDKISEKRLIKKCF